MSRTWGIPTGKLLSLCTATICLAFQATERQAGAQTYTLADANSQATVDTASSAGMNSWSVDGQNQLSQQWFWYRIGNTGTGNPDQPINTLSAASVNQPVANLLKTTYTGSQLRIEVDYTLNGQDPGSGGADMQETIKIKNVSLAGYTLHFFQYSDFDLGGSPLGDSVALNVDQGTGLFTGATQSKLNINLTETTSQTSDIPFASHGEVDTFNNTLTRLGTSYDLNDNASAGPGDVTWALEWNLNIAAGQTITISKDKLISGVAVPEPSALALAVLGLGFAAFAVRRRA